MSTSSGKTSTSKSKKDDQELGPEDLERFFESIRAEERKAKELRQKNLQKNADGPDDDPPTKQIQSFHALPQFQQDFILWVREILQPSNLTIVSIITHKAHGFDRGIPSCFTELMAHINEYQVILRKWEQDPPDYSHMMPTTTFPDICNQYIEMEFQRLRKRKKMILLGLEFDPTSSAPEEENINNVHPRRLSSSTNYEGIGSKGLGGSIVGSATSSKFKNSEAFSEREFDLWREKTDVTIETPKAAEADAKT